MSLYQRLTDIRATMKSRIEEALGDRINACIIGHKSLSKYLKPPLIWILPQASTIDNESFAINEQWNLIFIIFAVVKSTRDDEEARQEVEKLCIDAVGSLLVKDTLRDRDLDGLISTIYREEWLPGDSRIIDVDEALYGAAHRLRLNFQNTEVT